MNPPDPEWQFTPWETMRSLLIWTRCVLFLGLVLLFFLPVALTLPKRVYDPWLRLIARLMLRCAGVKCTVSGLENIDPHEPYILTPNHVNILDPFIYQGYFPKLLRGLEKKENFAIPVWGWWMRAVGQLEVDRENPRKALESMKAVARTVHQERTSVMVAPEGTRTPNGRLQPFKRGPFWTAAQVGARILPMCNKGLYSINRKGDWRIKPGHVEIVYGKPLGPPDGTSASQKAISAELRQWMLSQLGEEDGYPWSPS